jgi:formate C-acetyltransferase
MLAKIEASGFGSTERIQRLKANRVYPGIADEAVEYTAEERTRGQVNYLKELKTHIRTYSKICPERARYFTDGYRESDGQPEVIRFARAVANTLDNMTIYIEDGELIVGNYASSAVALPVYPECFCGWIKDAIGPDGMFKNRVTDDDRNELYEIVDYWEDRCYRARMDVLIPPELEDWVSFNGVTLTYELYEVTPSNATGFETLLANGSNGMIKKCRERLEQVKREKITGAISAKEYVDKVANLEAMIVANEAFVRFGKRYAALALELAQKEKDAARKSELEKIAEVCERVPAEPARNLYESLQSYYLFHMVQATISSRAVGFAVRFDTMFYPFYKKDLEEGRITREQALELIECLWVKIESISNIRPPQMEAITVGSSSFQTITLGGILKNGEDATNEMSYLAVEASMNVHTIQPTIVVRYHSKIDPKFIDKCIDCIRTGLGFPAFLSDVQAYPMYLRQGVPETDVWNWACCACISRTMPGKNIRNGNSSMGNISYGKCFHLALTDGFDSFTGKQLGAHTGDPGAFKSLDDFKEAYLKQLDHVMTKFMPLYYIGEEVRVRFMKRPLVSPYVDRCIEKAMTTTDFAGYETYNNPEIQCVGAINVADSLTAIKKLVFDEKKVTIEELLEALENNWEGREDLRQMCLNASKYGNDNAEADEMAKWVHHKSQGVLGKHKDYWGGQVRSQGGVMSAYYSFGRACQATPDGRVESQPFADGTASPMAGMDKKGPTATLSSLSKLDPMLANEMLCNQKFMPQFLEGENKKLFADYLKTWYDMGNWHIQFNVVDKEVLIDAQDHPEIYPDLVVRVAGYSAYWVDLGKPLQDDIIKRSEQSFASC